MLLQRVWQQDKEEPRKAHMSHFIFPAVNSDDTLLVPSSKWRGLIKAVSHRTRLITIEKKPGQHRAPEIYSIKAHVLEEMTMEWTLVLAKQEVPGTKWNFKVQCKQNKKKPFVAQHKVNLLPQDTVNMGEGEGDKEKSPSSKRQNHLWLRKPVRQIAGRDEQGNSTHACPVTVFFSGIH